MRAMLDQNSDKARNAEGASERTPLAIARRAALFGWWTVLPASLLLVGAVAAAYSVKSWLGIDLFEDHFVLHRLLFD